MYVLWHDAGRTGSAENDRKGRAVGLHHGTVFPPSLLTIWALLMAVEERTRMRWTEAKKRESMDKHVGVVERVDKMIGIQM